MTTMNEKLWIFGITLFLSTQIQFTNSKSISNERTRRQSNDYDEFDDFYHAGSDKSVYEEDLYENYEEEDTGEVLNVDLVYICSSVDEQIPLSQMCNGVRDCSDGSDEILENCQRRNITPAPSTTTLPPPPTTTKATTTTTEEPYDETCTDDEILCDNMLCLPNFFVCDGLADCDDGSDEANCPGMTTTPLPDDNYENGDIDYNFDGQIIPDMVSLEYTTDDYIRSSSTDPYELYYEEPIEMPYPDHDSGSMLVIQKSETKPVVVEIETQKDIIEPIFIDPVPIQVHNEDGQIVQPSEIETNVIPRPVAFKPIKIEPQPESNEIVFIPMEEATNHDYDYGSKSGEFHAVYRYDADEYVIPSTEPPVPTTEETLYAAEANVPEPITMNFENIVQSTHEPEVHEDGIPVIYDEDQSEDYSDEMINNNEIPQIDNYETSPGGHRFKGWDSNNNGVDKIPDSALLSALLAEIAHSNNQFISKRLNPEERRKKKVEKQRKKVRGLIGQLLHHVGKLIQVEDNNSSIIEKVNINYDMGLSNNESSNNSKLKISFDINL